MSQNNKDEPAEILALFDKRPTQIKPGLDRISAALDLLGNPGLKTPRIVVAGTNGKGSTSGMIWRLLAAAGIRAGLFSSPHLMEFRERITVTDRDVSNELIVRHLHSLKSSLPGPLWSELTFFEINTILSLLIFDSLGTEVNVLEVGLGGRLDCVNVYDADVAIITSIGLDHQEFLGSTLTAIAREKAGITRPGKPVVWGGPRSSEAEAHTAIVECVERVGAVLLSENEDPSCQWPPSMARRPEFLRRNFKLALMAVRELASAGLVKGLEPAACRNLPDLFDDVRLPWPVTLNGRFDLLRVSKNNVSRVVLVDVCHNPHGARYLVLALEESALVPKGAKANCLISVLADKDATGIWDEIKGKIRDVIRFQIPSPRTWQSDDNKIPGVMVSSFADAWAEAIQRDSWDTAQPWLLFGSVAAVGDVFSFWKRDGWSTERINAGS
jgi:dihydrofolate synthase/folylpolyglutamate synthase